MPIKDTLKYTSSYETKESLQYYTEAVFNVGMLNCEQTLIYKYFGENKNIRIADLGCGTGRFALNAALKGYYKIVGFDISESSIDKANSLKANSKFEKYAQNASFHWADLTETNLSEFGKYDLAFFTFNSLMCIPGHKNKILALQNAFNSLDKEGILIFTADEVNNDPHKERFIMENEEYLKINNIRNWRPADVVYHIKNQEGVLCFYNKDDILSLIKEAKLSSPIFTAKRDEIASESEIAKKFSDNAYYYVIRKL